MAKIRVRLFGVFRMDTHVAETEIEAARLKDVFGALNDKLGIQKTESGLAFKDALIYVNGEPCARKSTKLNDGDELWLLSPASGG